MHPSLAISRLAFPLLAALSHPVSPLSQSHQPYLSDLYKVDAYPTLVLFRLDRAHVTYSGPLSSHAIGSWLRRMLHPLQPVSSVSALVSFLAEPPRALVFCAPPLDEEAILLKHSAVVQAAEESANVRFGLVSDQPVTRYFELSAGRVPGFPPEYGECACMCCFKTDTKQCMCFCCCDGSLCHSM